MKNRLLKGELSTIFKNKKILIPIIAVMLIPVLYAGMFLWAFWDPYDKLDKLPVAIVNDDQGATMDGEHLKIGDDLAKNLKKSKEFDFVSVDKEEGYKKLKDQKYYMLVEIPKDFSKNATTLLDQKPKKLELKYVPNEGYNFLSAQIGGSAAYKIKTAVAEQVSETYAETMFKKISESADGVKQASDGARKLSDGSIDLNKGSKDLKEGLATMAAKSIEFENGMKTADSGANKVASGSKDLKDGLATMSEKSIVFENGMKTADSGANKVASGSKDLKDGLVTLSEKSIVFENGMKTANSGANKAASGSKDISNGVSALSQKSVEFNDGIKDASSGSKKLMSGSVDLMNGLAKADSNIPLLIDGTNKVSDGAEKLKNDLPAGIADQINKQLTGSVGALNSGIDQFESQLGVGLASQIADQTIAAQTAKMQELGKTLIANGVSPALVKGIMDQEQQNAPTKEQLQTQILNELNPQMKGAFNQFKSEVNSQLLGATNGLEKSIKDGTDPNFDKLIGGIREINQNQKLLQQGIHDLYVGSTDLNKGANNLSSGMNRLANGSDQMNLGIGQLVIGSNALYNGNSDLANGINQLTAGAGAITSGSGKLADGSKTLYNGASDLSSGMNQLTAGAGAITSGSGQLADGSKALNNGALELVNGMNQLTAGAGAITSGSGQLADGSTQLNDGTTKISDGAKELADKLSDGAKEASKVHSNDKTYNMMASPVNLDTNSVNHVPNYGTGFTPYFLSLGLFVGALLLSIVFPIREPALAPRSGFNWFISKFSILASLGVIQALIADLVILGWLGLHVQSVPKFILFSIITSLTFIALVQLLVTVFADAGRFIAIVILILQLTTSAGTFPLELIPGFLQHFNAFLPMTYTVSGFKAVISSGDFGYMWHNFLILLTYILAFALGTIAYLSMRYKIKYKKVAD